MADGLLFEQLLRAELDALTLGAGDDLQTEDRVAAQFEEVVGAAHLLQLEHIGPDRGELFLDLADRCGVALFDHARSGQGAFVEFAVGGQRQTLEHQDLRWHEVFRQACGQLFAQGFSAYRRHAPRHQLQTRLIAVQRLGQHHRFGDAFQGLQQLPDFTGLDPIATDFHLIVSATQILQHAIHPARAVACTVQAFAIGFRVRHEAFGSHRRTAQIALRQTRAAKVQLAGDTLGDRVQVCVQHPRLAVGQRLANRDTAAGGQLFSHFVGEDADRGFGGTVVVDDPAARLERANLLDQGPGTGFSTQNQHLPGQHIGGPCGL
ncbi:hypothetical protein PS689_05206 [Pseudomonas fluorescens]|nr:hypothetical protein PS689_05206 [Pseudomonas fluorescens]